VESQKQYQYLFSTWYDNEAGIKALLQHAKDSNIKNVAIIRPIPAGFWQYTRNMFVQHAPEYGVNIVEDLEGSDPLAMDYRTFLAKVKTKNPDALFVVTSDPAECPLLRQAKELGFTKPILATEAAGNSASLQQCPDMMGQLYFSTPRATTRTTDFIKRFQYRFGREPQYPSVVTTYDAVMVIAGALEKSGLARNEDLRKEIASTDMESVSYDRLKFNNSGYVETPADAFEVQTVREKKFVPIKSF
jgi:branched-chain amino acid transport system substrate-binding protein